jgi:hypothetical protein
MKKIVLLVIMLLIVAAVLQASIFTKAEQYTNEINALLIAIGTLVGTAIGIWYQIRDHRKKDSLKDELTKAALPFIMEAKDSPLTLLQKLTDPPRVDLVTDPKDSRNKIVAAALLEKEPKKTKKLGLKDLISAGNFISSIYSTVKPLVKKIKG